VFGWGVMAKYRSRVEIIADVLTVASVGAKKTRIMYFANLSYKLLEKYLAETTKIGFIHFNNGGYELTERGRRFLERYNAFSNKYSSVEKTLKNMRYEKQVLERMCEPTSDFFHKSMIERRNRARTVHPSVF
jgi:predicted transcriptional regulator